MQHGTVARSQLPPKTLVTHAGPKQHAPPAQPVPGHDGARKRSQYAPPSWSCACTVPMLARRRRWHVGSFHTRASREQVARGHRPRKARAHLARVDELGRHGGVLRVLDSRKAPPHVTDESLDESLVVPQARQRHGRGAAQRRSTHAAASSALHARWGMIRHHHQHRMNGHSGMVKDVASLSPRKTRRRRGGEVGLPPTACRRRRGHAIASAHFGSKSQVLQETIS